MSLHVFRVRRNTADGLQVVGLFDTLQKAASLATRRVRETGGVFRIERRTSTRTGWETAQELVPETNTPIEAAIARGHMPKVQNAEGRKGQVLSYIRPTREVRVVWTDLDRPGRGEVVPVDQLSLR